MRLKKLTRKAIFEAAMAPQTTPNMQLCPICDKPIHSFINGPFCGVCFPLNAKVIHRLYWDPKFNSICPRNHPRTPANTLKSNNNVWFGCIDCRTEYTKRAYNLFNLLGAKAAMAIRRIEIYNEVVSSARHATTNDAPRHRKPKYCPRGHLRTITNQFNNRSNVWAGCKVCADEFKFAPVELFYQYDVRTPEHLYEAFTKAGEPRSPAEVAQSQGLPPRRLAPSPA